MHALLMGSSCTGAGGALMRASKDVEGTFQIVGREPRRPRLMLVGCYFCSGDW